jgi:hypothetical protein
MSKLSEESSPKTRSSKPTFPHFISQRSIVTVRQYVKSYPLNWSHIIEENIEEKERERLLRVY